MYRLFNVNKVGVNVLLECADIEYSWSECAVRVCRH